MRGVRPLLLAVFVALASVVAPSPALGVSEPPIPPVETPESPASFVRLMVYCAAALNPVDQPRLPLTHGDSVWPAVVAEPDGRLCPYSAAICRTPVQAVNPVYPLATC